MAALASLRASRLLRPCASALRGTRGVAHSTVEVGGATLAYRTAGSGPLPVLCLPGALGSGAVDFAPQMSGFADSEQVTLVAWDPPGYGNSRPPQRNFHPRFLHDDADMAHQLMTTLGHSRYGALGWSDGGITALILASRQRAVCAVCAVAANAVVTDADAAIYRGIRDVSKWSARMRAGMEAMYGEDFPALWHSWVDAFLAIHEQGGDICRGEAAAIQCPTLLVTGGRDPMVPPQHGAMLRLIVPGARLHEFPEAKHNPHQKCAQEFNRLVSAFFEEADEEA